MLHSTDLDYIWDLLDTSQPESTDLRVHELEDTKVDGNHPLFAIDNKKQRQILILTKHVENLIQDTKSSGIHIVSREMLDSGNRFTYLVIICRKPHLNELFSIIITEILNELNGTSARPDLVAQKVLNQWRELLERNPSDMPTIENIIGVFGELWHLRKLVKINPLCVSCWFGPTDARFDLSSGSIALEVKASLTTIGRFIVIHGHEQLELPHNGKLYLASLKLERDQDRGENLTELISDIVKLGGNSQLLHSLLVRVGFASYTIENCDDMRFVIKESHIFRVDDSFPRIVSSSFVEGKLPNGILKLDYTIDLTSEPPYPLTNTEVENLYIELASKVK